jgi:FkbM family methyltransferase
MAVDPGDESLLGDHGDLAGYRFWTALTAAQANNLGRPTEVVGRRVRRFFHEVCRLVQPDLVLELGAHEAKFSRWAKREFPDAQCLALEANPYVYRRFVERLGKRGVDYRNLAATSASGPVEMIIPTRIWDSTKGLGNKMGSLVTHRGDVGHETVQVDGVRVDELVDVSTSGPLVSWVDVEGASEAVLEGSRDVMAAAAAVYIEVESDEVWPGQWLDLDVARYFLSLGMVPAMRDVQRPQQYNVVFLSPALAARPEVAELAAGVMRPARPSAE